MAAGTELPEATTAALAARLARAACIAAGERVLALDGDGQCWRSEPLAGDLDAVLCVTEESDLPAIRSQLADWQTVLRRGGRVGVAIRCGPSPTDLEGRRQIFREAGFDRVDVRTEVVALSPDSPEPFRQRVVYVVGWI